MAKKAPERPLEAFLSRTADGRLARQDASSGPMRAWRGHFRRRGWAVGPMQGMCGSSGKIGKYSKSLFMVRLASHGSRCRNLGAAFPGELVPRGFQFPPQL